MQKLIDKPTGGGEPRLWRTQVAADCGTLVKMNKEARDFAEP